MPLPEPLAIGIVRARDRAQAALRELKRLIPKGQFFDSTMAIQGCSTSIRRLRICVEADRVVAQMVIDKTAINGDASPNQPLP